MNIFNLIDKLEHAEHELQKTEFVAPCVLDGKVRTRLDGLVRTFAPSPAGFEGWGVFQPDGKRAALVEPASLATVERYLALFEPLRVLLVGKLSERSWVAFPANGSDMAQRFGQAHPMVVHLVDGGRAFDTVIARTDGGAWWFEESDRRADPRLAEDLRDALRHMWHPNRVRVRGMTPEMRSAYAMAWKEPDPESFDWTRPEGPKRPLEEALRRAGGQLRSYSDEGEYFNVEWATAEGKVHHSAIDKDDLTVISAGICLSGRDRDFDLQSLVGVVEGWNRQEWW
ncbi:hypothetical protein FIV42_20245 [Persicimonas caeni]|uniref:Uncharacterized protein n=1 Tax=Persicimonas caeni TaxID=2292766 RepID=A0A4Y6PXD6_PERCE|nr:hypothetical protein [Persicimonas caeni]QDG52991.1 hypothetical protein FIV42_20245 [Persicimonas caeni]QED34213.1 hypothetical protein FRD00_20240 [Persicimonas caeni]